MNTKTVLSAMTLFLCLSFGAKNEASGLPQPENKGKIVAVVGARNITSEEIDVLISRMEGMGKKFSVKEKELFYAMILQSLVKTELLEQYARKNGFEQKEDFKKIRDDQDKKLLAEFTERQISTEILEEIKKGPDLKEISEEVAKAQVVLVYLALVSDKISAEKLKKADSLSAFTKGAQAMTGKVPEKKAIPLNGNNQARDEIKKASPGTILVKDFPGEKQILVIFIDKKESISLHKEDSEKLFNKMLVALIEKKMLEKLAKFSPVKAKDMNGKDFDVLQDKEALTKEFLQK